jgi:hypothetical protein
MTVGADARGKAQVVQRSNGAGQFNMHLKALGKYYSVRVQAPAGYRFTSGVCDSEAEEGTLWACNYDYAIDKKDDDGRRTLKERNAIAAFHRRIQGNSEEAAAAVTEGVDEIGLQSGRSTQCVYVDMDGNVDHALGFGVRRVGDSQAVGTNVALLLEFDEDSVGKAAASSGRRLFEDIIRTATVLEEHVEGSTVTTRYLLGEEEKKAVGTVTAEVLAATLDGRLAKEGIQLESVNPKDVVLSNTSGGTEASKLAVNMEIKGHYSPPPHIDFDYIVSESINADSDKIRRGLQTYNTKCSDQTSKVQDQGYGKDDFAAVVSNAGASRVGRNQGRPVASDVSSLDNIYSTACSSDLKLPDKFETSLKEIEARSTDDLGLKISNNIKAAEESSGGMEAWATGPVAAIAGMIVLLMGAFVFRRALGPRRADKYSDARKTKDVIDKEEMRRFGEAGGAMDDGSVDSAFYSDAESDLEETEKERKMRRKRKEKDDEQRKTGGKSSSSKSKSSRYLNKNDDKNEFLGFKIDVSNGSDDTESVGKSSKSSDEVAAEKRREKKRSGKDRSSKDRSDRKKSSSSSKKQDRESSSKRGRSKRSGGDNANIV